MDSAVDCRLPRVSSADCSVVLQPKPANKNTTSTDEHGSLTCVFIFKMIELPVAEVVDVRALSNSVNSPGAQRYR